jgi:hypothetical protein
MLASIKMSVTEALGDEIQYARWISRFHLPSTKHDYDLLPVVVPGNETLNITHEVTNRRYQHIPVWLWADWAVGG